MRDMRILVAEDDPQMVEMMRDQLALRGIDVVSATCGAEALERLLDEEGFDAVVTDVSMPRGDGLEVLAGVRARFVSLPVVLMSAFPTDEVRARAREAGDVAFLTKPFSIDELIAVLESPTESGAPIPAPIVEVHGPGSLGSSDAR